MSPNIQKTSCKLLRLCGVIPTIQPEFNMIQTRFNIIDTNTNMNIYKFIPKPNRNLIKYKTNFTYLYKKYKMRIFLFIISFRFGFL